MKAEDTQRIRNMLLLRLLLLPSAVLLIVCGIIVYFLVVPIEHADWLLVVRRSVRDASGSVIAAISIALTLLAVAVTAVSLAGYWMAANTAARLKLADMETRHIRTQLIQAGRMAEVGEMSAGIAHEINNPLQVMMAELAMLQSIAEDLEPVVQVDDAEKIALLKESTEVIGNQIKRCSRITQGLLSFSRKAENALRPVCLQTFLPQMVNLVDQRARGENIHIVQQIEATVPDIVSDANQLQQVFLNLLNNAIYALRGRPQPEIRIQATRQDNAVAIAVADNGCGFRPEDLEKAFMPFFTTKPVGVGTGLGLSTAYGIIKGLGGEITLTSEFDGGSTFLVRLPLAPGENHKDIRN